METINILKALIELVDQATFNVNTRGATQIAGLAQAANDLVARLEAAQEDSDAAVLNDTLAEISSDVK